MSSSGLQVEHSTFAVLAYRKLKDAILSGEIAPGANLIEKELAFMLNVSRTPVRSACQRLEADGLLISSPHRGMSVKVLSRAEAQDAYEVRAVLEGLSARLATERATDAELEELRRKYIGVARAEDWHSDAQFLWRQKFHIEIARLSRNSDLSEKLSRSINRIALWRNTARREGVRFRITDGEHDQVVTLMLQRRAAEARLCMEEHIERSWRNSIENL